MTLWRRAAARLVAMLVVALALADLTDAACDPIRWPVPESATTVVAGAAADLDDACLTSCVQDCFCCSRSEAAGSAALSPTLNPVAEAPAEDPLSIAPVVRAVPQRPPLALS